MEHTVGQTSTLNIYFSFFILKNAEKKDRCISLKVRTTYQAVPGEKRNEKNKTKKNTGPTLPLQYR